MKKIIYYSVLALFFAAFSLTSCEDVPMPYDMPTDPSNPTGDTGDYYLKESFASGFGDFTVETIKGTPWVISYSCATASGYDSSSGATTESESYLVSKAVDLSDATEVYLQFDYIYRYGSRSGAANKVYISSAYTGDPTTTSWTDITGTLTEGSDWNTFYTYAVNIPAEFLGKSSVVVSLYYACASSSATWEVKNLVMADGTAEEGGTTSGEGNTSTPENPYTVSELIPLISALPSGGTMDDVYVKGIVSEITEISPSYGNMTYYISDDGTTSNQLLIYRGKSLNNASPSSSNEIKLGDEVIVCGQFVNYYGNTPEGAQGATYIYSLNGVTAGGGTEGSGSGTVDDPYTASTARALISALPSGGTIDDIYVKGIISVIDEISTSYGNATYYISDDGTMTDQLEIFRGYSLGNAKFTSTSEIKEGDEVIVYGQFVNYYGNTPEGAQGATWIYSLNGVTADGGTTGDGSGSGTVNDPYTASKAISVAQTLSSSETISGVYVKGIISTIQEIDTGSYGNATYFISDDGTTGNQFEIYRGYYLGGAKFTSSDQIKLGDEVVVTGDLVNFYGNTPELTTGNHIYSLNGATSDTGDSGDTGGEAGGVSISGTTVTLTNSDATAGSSTAYINMDIGIDNGTSVDGQSFSFDDGSTVTFAKNGGSTAPAYYEKTYGIRVYAMNTMTFNCSKKIASIKMTCDSLSGTNYVGNSTATVEFTDTGAVYCNYHSSTSGGTQLRVQTITITYAE